ncbi:SDR family oxidoreductase [Pontixanthobacter gangjinensis]|uniref:SDR family oxidoreductase n=1 Tax=Christiangramia aestuarii TaxID=1028746 RepID=A0A7K1LNS9_9FLAO|nr:NAD(P)-binding oxidoreductase [Christiangramia aestuarii]MUP42465.1 SDR family oxidoreductase [Christiangramia aestuarii]
MTTLVAGASGATGRKLVEQLLERGEKVKAIVRSPENLPASWQTNPDLEIIKASLLELSNQELQKLTKDCHAIASCLGHNLTLKGVFGKPRRLVTDAVRKLTEAAKANAPEKPVKFVLMNTSGNSNRDLNEPVSFAQKCVIGLLRLTLPPHVDNEKAADHLRLNLGREDELIEWVAVRPDGLINEEKPSEYEIHPSPIRSAIFDAGKVSRINVAHFMAELITSDELWRKWKGQMPVIYSKEMDPK